MMELLFTTSPLTVAINAIPWQDYIGELATDFSNSSLNCTLPFFHWYTLLQKTISTCSKSGTLCTCMYLVCTLTTIKCLPLLTSTRLPVCHPHCSLPGPQLGDSNRRSAAEDSTHTNGHTEWHICSLSSPQWQKPCTHTDTLLMTTVYIIHKNYKKVEG